MQMLGALATKVISGAKAIGGVASSAAAGSSTTLSALQGASGVLGAVMQIGAGRAANEQAQAEAYQLELEANEEFITGKETAAALKNELARTVGNQRVAFAAGGVDLSSVSVDDARSKAISDAENELELSSNTQLARSLSSRQSAANRRAQGRTALRSSYIGAAAGLAQTGADIVKRG